MKQLLVFIGFAVLTISCNNNGPGSTATVDSVGAARAAKDSLLEKNKTTALVSVQAFSSGKMDEAFIYR